MDFSALNTLINSEPANAAKSDADVAVWLNTPSITRQAVSLLTTRSLMSELGPVMADSILTKLEAASSGNQILARTLMMMRPSEGGVDFGHAATRAQIDALVGAGVINQAEGNALQSLGNEQVSPGCNAGFGEISQPEITYARTV